MRRYVQILIICITVVGISCSNAPVPPEFKPPETVENPSQSEDTTITITDRTGKVWDVTHAVLKYGFKADEFQFGVGPNTIRPIIAPRFLEPNDPGYPDSSGNFLVIGANINGDKRAYPISVLNHHEVVDEKFGDQHVAVAY